MSESRAVTALINLSDERNGEFTSESVYASYVNTTSPAVTARPSCQRARGSRWNTSVTGPSHSHRSASCGWKSSSPIVFPDIPRSASLRNSWSYTSRLVESSVTGGSRMSGSPAAAMTTVPQ